MKMGIMYEFKVVSSLYKETKTRGCRLVRANVITRRMFRLDEVTFSEMIGAEGNVLKRRCILQHRDGDKMVILGNYEKMRQMTQPIEIKGFMR